MIVCGKICSRLSYGYKDLCILTKFFSTSVQAFPVAVFRYVSDIFHSAVVGQVTRRLNLLNCWYIKYSTYPMYIVDEKSIEYKYLPPTGFIHVECLSVLLIRLRENKCYVWSFSYNR